MRTAGLIQADTPNPDGRIMIRPQDFLGGGTPGVVNGVPVLTFTGALVGVFALLPGILLRYGMSDDAQQNFGMGAPGAFGIQGAQAQVVTTGQPFTTPYGPDGRPPQPSRVFGQPVTSRPKGLKPTAITIIYSVSGSAMTSLQIGALKSIFNVGVVPFLIEVLGTTNLPLQVATTQVITTPIPPASQQFLADPFSEFGINLVPDAGAGTMTLFGVWVDVAFNYN